ncbi:Pectinesterase inhibitor [Thalictrum thalictroides]|uniref:Pectinesterase inhibitor n=1 Tax=Thalictrum thalictroides TaxID=46969 RepID=A0A7J6VDE8_THATH|nr:Pectinesterase inhibitor [Thalictrum thalictroides]
MAKFTILFLLLSLLALTSTVYSAVTKGSVPSSFVKSSCSVTRYPDLCIQSLAMYSSTIQRSPKQMAQTALSVSLVKARSAKAYVIKMSKSKGLKRREYQVVRDCVDNIGDSVDRLSKSITELGYMSQGKAESFMWHMSNVQTWVSAALTDENTCVDGFAGRGMNGMVKSTISAKITNVAQCTSNALALINRFADRH